MVMELVLVIERIILLFIYIIRKEGLRLKIGWFGCLGGEYWW